MAMALRVPNIGPKIVPQCNFASRTVTVLWKSGLNERPAAVIMDFIKNFRSKITFRVESGGIGYLKKHNRKSMTNREQCNGIAAAVSLKGCCGSKLVIEAAGPEAQEALNTIMLLFKETEKRILEDYKYLKGEKRPFLPYLYTSAGPRFNSNSSGVRLARSIARSKLSDQLHAQGMPIRYIDGPDVAIPPQIEYLSGFIPFHKSAIEKPHDVDLSKIPAAFLVDQWEIGNQLVNLRNDAADDEPWLMIELPIKGGRGIEVIPCVSGKGMMDDYKNVQFYADHKWWRVNADHPARSAEMKITNWYGFDITVMEWLAQVFAKYPKLYVVIKDPASGRSVGFYDYMGLDWYRHGRSRQPLLDAISLGVEKGSNLGFEIKGPYAEAELVELKKVFLRPHEWHS